MVTAKAYVAGVFKKVKQENEHETEFLQAVEEVFDSLVPVLKLTLSTWKRTFRAVGRT